MSCIVIVRHGDTFAPSETPRRIGARTDLPLVDSGLAQVVALRAAFVAEGVRFGRAYASPLLRAQQTAATLLAGTGLDAVPAAWLSEIDHGPDENRTEPEVLRRIGSAALEAWERDGRSPPGWVVDPEARIADWQAFLATHADHIAPVLIVTSNGAARFALRATVTLRDDATALSSPKLRTGAFGRLDLTRNGWRLAVWDRRPVPGCARPILDR